MDKNQRIEFGVIVAESKAQGNETASLFFRHMNEQGYEFIGLVGQYGIRSLVSLDRLARSFGIKPLLGLEALIVKKRERTLSAAAEHDTEDDYFSCYIYALSSLGKNHLFRLLSLWMKYKPGRMDADKLQPLRTGMLVMNGCDKDELLHTVLHRPEQAEAVAAFYDALMIKPAPLLQGEQGGAACFTRADYEQANRIIYELGKRLGKPVIATLNVRVPNTGESLPTLISTDEMLREFAYLGEKAAYEVVVEQPNRLAALFEHYDLLPTRRLFPVIENSAQKLRSLCFKAAEDQYGSPLLDRVKERLNSELDSIIDHEFASCYLIAAEAAGHAAQHKQPVGARGSAGASITAYFTGITEINPLPPHYLCKSCKRVEWIDDAGNGFDLIDRTCPQCGGMMQGDGHNIPQEMFLGVQGEKAPNIDWIVAPEYQAEAENELKRKFGKEKIVYPGTTDHHPQPAGVYVVPDHVETEEVTPVIYQGADSEIQREMTYFDYRLLDPIWFRLDFISNDYMSALRLLQDLTGVHPQNIPMNDPKVLSLFRHTEELGVSARQLRSKVGTYGIPEMNVPFVRDMLEKVLPHSFSELVQISGLSHGTGTWEDNAWPLIQSGEGTIRSVIGCRDNVMLDLIHYGIDRQTAFAITDRVRRGEGLLPDQVELLERHSVPHWYRDALSKIKYAFPKAHAVSYVMLALRLAFYKLYFPLEFYAAYFTVRVRDDNLFDLISQGYRDIAERLQTIEIAIAANGSEYPLSEDKSTLEVALEMTARGFRMTREPQDNPVVYWIHDDTVKKLAVPLQNCSM
ncbi:DNA polymerase III PolC-type [Paenibacillus konkukensis]|uniref:DNA polymerase III PolC-type n=1 Tax=Paenibacillus konkukensis TaxID=2020716 RepID=A0ABY4S114_9BACL|nr:PHP domain-containing protein [Paenibacillus konkukensis]UQZ87484.1 DNA polymerase III PolC-type [Paenibacillus konkukensis]